MRLRLLMMFPNSLPSVLQALEQQEFLKPGKEYSTRFFSKAFKLQTNNLESYSELEIKSIGI
jgi:hypothetical protein